MNIVLAYNESDWSSGWTTFLDGFTMYYADRKEQDLDFKVIDLELRCGLYGTI